MTSKKDKRNVAGMVCDYISHNMRAIDCPNSEAILHLHTLLERHHDFALLNGTASGSKGTACLAAKCIFILEKLQAGYALHQIPECLSRRQTFINQYFNFRTRRHDRYRIAQGPIATAVSIDAAIARLSPRLSSLSTMAPC